VERRASWSLLVVVASVLPPTVPRPDEARLDRSRRRHIPAVRSRTAAQTPSTSSSSIEMPMETAAGRLRLPVRVNGRAPFPFGLDTGASGTVWRICVTPMETY
jgi:hypothetical protein